MAHYGVVWSNLVRFGLIWSGAFKKSQQFQGGKMLFYGRNKCVLDASGRIKLPPWAKDTFDKISDSSLVFYCMPEGCLAVFPAARWQEFRKGLDSGDIDLLSNGVKRMQMRLVGCMSQIGEVSNQGRITVPLELREEVGLDSAKEVMVSGSEKWLEVWNLERWKAELARIREHAQKKLEIEMKADLQETKKEQQE